MSSRRSAARHTVVDDARRRSGDAAQNAAVLDYAHAAVILSTSGRGRGVFASDRPMFGAKPHMSAMRWSIYWCMQLVATV